MSTIHSDVMAAAPHPGSATFALGNDGPSPSRKGAVRGRASAGGSKIPHRTSSADPASAAFVATSLSPELKTSAWTGAPQPPQQSALSQGFPTVVSSSEAAGGGTAAQGAGLAAQGSNATPREGSCSVPSADLLGSGAAGSVQTPVFAVGVGSADRLGTPRSRTRANKHKSHGVGVSSLLSGSVAAAATAPPPTPFSPIALTLLPDDNTYQKATSHNAVVGGPSPMDITPQSSASSSMASSNIFLLSPLLGVAVPSQAAAAAAAAARGGVGFQTSSGPSAVVGAVSPAPFQGFTAAAGEVPPSPIFPVRFPAGGSAAAAVGNAATAPSETPAVSIQVPSTNSGSGTAAQAVVSPAGTNTAPSSAAVGGGGVAAAGPSGSTSVTGTASGGIKFPIQIQIQIPGAREVQDLFSSMSASAAFASGTAGPGVGNPQAKPAGSGTTGGGIGSAAPTSVPAAAPQQGLNGNVSSINSSGSSTAAPQVPAVHSWPPAVAHTGTFSSVAAATAAAAAAASKKLPDSSPGCLGGLSSGSGSGPPSQAGGNDCQPAKDNAPKVVRISSDSTGATTASASMPAHPASAPGSFAVPSASAPSRGATGVPVGGGPSASPRGPGATDPGDAATTAAALGLAAASAAAVASLPSEAPCVSPDVLEAVAEQLERMARRTREAAAAAAAARGGGAAAATKAVATALAGETSPSVRSVLELILRPDVLNGKSVGGAAPDGTPGLAAAVACMIGGLRLDDTHRTSSGGGASSGEQGAAAATAATAHMPFVFGMDSGSRMGSAGSATASSTAATTGPFGSATAAAAAAVAGPASGSAAILAPTPSVPFVFGGVPSAASSGGAAPATAGTAPRGAAPGPSAAAPAGGTAGPSAAAAPSGATAASPDATSGPASRPGSNSVPASVPFTFGATSTPRGQPGSSASTTTSAASAGARPATSGVSASGAVTFTSASAASPMSTTPVSSNHQQLQQQPMATSSSGWTHAPRASSSASAGGGEPLKFTVGSSGGPVESAAACSGGVTPGRSGTRARPKITPRKTRSAGQSEAGAAPRATAPGNGPTGSTAAASAATTAPAAAASSAAAAAQQSASHSAAGSALPQPAAHSQSQQQQQQQAQQSPSSEQQGLDSVAVQAVRLKRSADEKKQYGNQKYEQSDFKSAERWYTEAIDLLEQQLAALSLSRDKLQQLFPTLKTEVAVLYSNRSGARLMTSKPHSALEDALRAMALDPKFMRAASRAATCHCRLGDFAAAHRIIDSAMDRCSASSSHYQDMLKKLNEVVDLGARARAATAAAMAAAANGSREKLQEAADQLAAIRDQVSYCDVVAAARAVLALRLGAPRDALTLVAPHPEVPLAQRSAPWRMWLTVQARFFRGDMQEAITTCRELQLALENTDPSSNGSASTCAPAPAATEQDPPSPTAAAAPYTTAAHVTVPPPAVLSELVENMQRQLKLREDGNGAYKAGRYSEAAELYTSALALGCCPTFAAVLHGNRAATHQAQGQLADAVADCGRARALDPAYYRASSRLASLMLELRRPENAQGLLEPLTKLGAQSGGSGPAPEELTKLKEQLSEARSAVSWQKTPHHYKLLGLASNCSEEDVRKAYRRLALKHHPDKAMAAVRVSLSLPGQAGGAPYSGPVVGASELETRVREEASWLFNFINQAHEELSDKARRRKVDQLLEVEQPPTARYGNSSTNPYNGSYYGGSRYGGFSNMYGFDPFFQRPAASTGAPGSGRTRTATGGGASGGAGSYGAGYGSYGSYGGARPNSSRPAATAGAGSGNNSTRSSHGNAPGGARPGASAGSGASYGAYARGPGGGGVGRSSAGGRKWWEGGTDGSDDEEQDTFNF